MNEKWAEYYITDQTVVSWYLWYYDYTFDKYGGKGKIFRQWRNGEPHNQPLNQKYWSSRHYRLVAKLLNLPNWDKFTGHSMCRTAASIMSANGLSLYCFFIRVFVCCTMN